MFFYTVIYIIFIIFKALVKIIFFSTKCRRIYLRTFIINIGGDNDGKFSL